MEAVWRVTEAVKMAVVGLGAVAMAPAFWGSAEAEEQAQAMVVVKMAVVGMWVVALAPVFWGLATEAEEQGLAMLAEDWARTCSHWPWHLQPSPDTS